jgi:hypothetical protein
MWGQTVTLCPQRNTYGWNAVGLSESLLKPVSPITKPLSTGPAYRTATTPG